MRSSLRATTLHVKLLKSGSLELSSTWTSPAFIESYQMPVRQNLNSEAPRHTCRFDAAICIQNLPQDAPAALPDWDSHPTPSAAQTGVYLWATSGPCRIPLTPSPPLWQPCASVHRVQRVFGEVFEGIQLRQQDHAGKFRGVWGGRTLKN